MAKPKQKQFTVYVKVTVETELQIPADNFEQALEKARDYNVKDVVEFDTPYNDGEIEITGVFK